MPENLYTPNSIRTVSGRYINILELAPETLHIEDIAHALSHVPRFGGHLPVRYSVLQHVLDVHDRVKYATPIIRLQALMHDCSEALIQDIPSPFKRHLPDYQALEAKVMAGMAKHFGFYWQKCELVDRADIAALEAEWELRMLRASRSRALRWWLRLRNLWEIPLARRRFVKLYNDLCS